MVAVVAAAVIVVVDEEVLLKIPRLMNDFIYKYDLFTMNVMGMGEKNP